MTVEWSGFRIKPLQLASTEAAIARHELEDKLKSLTITMSRIDMTKSIEKEKRMGMFGFFLAKKELELEIRKLTSILDIEKKKLQAEYDILATQKSYELKEQIKLNSIECENKLNRQATLYNDSLQKLTTQHAETTSKLETKLAKEYYEKMTEALRELNLEGSAQTKYVQELSMKMFDKALEKPIGHMIEKRIIKE